MKYKVMEKDSELRSQSHNLSESLVPIHKMWELD